MSNSPDTPDLLVCAKDLADDLRGLVTSLQSAPDEKGRHATKSLQAVVVVCAEEIEKEVERAKAVLMAAMPPMPAAPAPATPPATAPMAGVPPQPPVAVQRPKSYLDSRPPDKGVR